MPSSILPVPADTRDLDGDGDSAEWLPYDLDGEPRFVDIPTAPGTGSGFSPLGLQESENG